MKWSVEDTEKLLTWDEHGLTPIEISRASGLSYQTVYNKLSKLHLRPWCRPGLTFGELLRAQRLEAEAARDKLRDGSRR